jgi:hypothetical protein
VRCGQVIDLHPDSSSPTRGTPAPITADLRGVLEREDLSTDRANSDPTQLCGMSPTNRARRGSSRLPLRMRSTRVGEGCSERSRSLRALPASRRRAPITRACTACRPTAPARRAEKNS